MSEMTKMQVNDGMDRRAVSTQHTGATSAPISGNASAPGLTRQETDPHRPAPSRSDPDACARNVPDDDREPDGVLSVLLGLFVGALFIAPLALALWVLS